MQARLLSPLNLDALDDNVLQRTVPRVGLGARDGVDGLARVVVGDLAEDGVLAVEPSGRPDRDEELRAVGALPAAKAGVRHGQQVRPGELEIRVDLVVERVSRAARTG